MALRLIEMVLPDKDGVDVHELLKEHKVLEHRQVRLLGGELLVRILLDAEQSESVLDLLKKRYGTGVGNRRVVLPVEATLPRAEPEPASSPGHLPSEESSPERIGREELDEDMEGCRAGFPALSDDGRLVHWRGRHRFAAQQRRDRHRGHGGCAIARAEHSARAPDGLGRDCAGLLSLMIGVLMVIDPTVSEVASRTRVGMGEIALALASGCAGALAFTTGVSATVIGVMVAVTLLPPLVTFGLLLGGGQPALAMGALSLFLVTLICVNLAGVATFIVQGIHPAVWWDKERAAKATRIAVTLWVVVLAILVGMILLLQKG